MSRKISRRDILKLFTVAGGSTAVTLMRRALHIRPEAVKGGELTPQVYLPFVGRYPGPQYGKVIHIHDTHATNWTGQTRFWEYVSGPLVDEMVNRGVTELTGASTVADAWRMLIPFYDPGQKIAIKVNFNNNQSCNNLTGVIDALVQPVNSVVSGLEQIGVPRANVCVYDAVRAISQRFVNGGLAGISYYDDGCRNQAGFSGDSSSYVTFYPPPGVSMPAEKVTDVVMNAAYLINMPIMKGGHPIAGVTLGGKNHFGTIQYCAGLHDYVNAVGKPTGYNSNYSPFVDFFRSPLIGGKTVLTIGDGLFAARQFNDKPAVWSTFGNHVPNSLFFATDPVAIDCVMRDFLAAELGSGLTLEANRYLYLAGNAGLGVYESVNPWTQTYANIKYTKIEL
jgi:hypothetical protein